MSTQKRGFYIGASIMAFLLSILVLIDASMSAAMLAGIDDRYSIRGGNAVYTVLWMIIVLCFVIVALNCIFGGLLLQKKDGKRFAIVLLINNCVLLVLLIAMIGIAGTIGALGVFELIFTLVVIVQLVAGLCVRNDEEGEIVETVNAVNEASVVSEIKIPKNKNTNANINTIIKGNWSSFAEKYQMVQLLKELKTEGFLTEEDFRKLLLKELDK